MRAHRLGLHRSTLRSPRRGPSLLATGRASDQGGGRSLPTAGGARSPRLPLRVARPHLCASERPPDLPCFDPPASISAGVLDLCPRSVRGPCARHEPPRPYSAI